MPARVLDGRRAAEAIRGEIALAVAAHAAAGGRPPGLAAVLVGDDPASHVYVRNKRKACQQAGIRDWLHHLPATTSQAELLALVAALNADPDVSGVLVQLPLPPQIDAGAVLDAIDPRKDVDAFHPDNVGRLAAGVPRFLPCTPHGVCELLRRNGVELAGRHVVVVGRSNIVGKPLALILMQKATPRFPQAADATVTVVHRGTRGLAAIARTADVLVAAAGSPRCVTPDMVAPGAAVVDVGTNSVDGRLVGDADPAVGDVAGWLSPVPGGVGPMTIAMLLKNTLLARTLPG